MPAVVLSQLIASSSVLRPHYLPVCDLYREYPTVRANFAVSFTYRFFLNQTPSSEFKQVIQFCPDNIQWSQWYAQIVEKFVWVKMLVFTWICTAPNSTRIIFQFSTTENDLFQCPLHILANSVSSIFLNHVFSALKWEISDESRGRCPF